jgi:hypothetical protein
MIGNAAAFIKSPGRTPTAALYLVRQGGIQRRPIDACLSAGSNLHA